MDRVSDINDRRWQGRSLVRAYCGGDLQPVEAQLFERHADALSGRVLELGCGGGRVTGHLAGRAAELHAIDISAEMLTRASACHPGVAFHQQDMTDLSLFADESFDAIVASCNVIDVLDDTERRAVLAEARRLLRPGGVLLFSSHNRDALGGVGQPWTLPRGGRLRGVVKAIALIPRRWRNHARLKPYEQHERDFDIVNDAAHDFSLLHYYISPADQARQLRECGLEAGGCTQLDGTPVIDAAPADQIELYYDARRPDVPATGGRFVRSLSTKPIVESLGSPAAHASAHGPGASSSAG